MNWFTNRVQWLCYYRLMNVLQFTDPHLYGNSEGKLRGVQTDLTLQAVLAEAFEAVPDYEVVLVTGDLVQDDPSGYLRFRKTFASCAKPVLCIAGNHDEPVAMRRELQGAPFQIGGSYEAQGWQFVMLDTYHAGHVGGLLSPAELQMLDAALGRSRAHAMICLHHHPIDMGSRWLDGIGLANAAEFWEVLDAHSNVRAVVWGHVHQEYESRRGAVKLFATPSTGAQFAPGTDKFALDSRPPGYRRFKLQPDGRIESAVGWVGAQQIRRSASR
jgi:3',5'-cyclic-AMP phosphodiesterase